MNAMRCGRRPATAAGIHHVPQRGALKGARIGVDERYFTPDYGGEPDSSPSPMRAWLR